MKQRTSAFASRVQARTSAVIVLVMVLLVTGFLGWYLLQQNAMHARVDTGSALAVARLHTSARELKDTFGQTQGSYNSAANTKKYLALVTDIKNDCKKVQSFTLKQAADHSDALSQYLAKSKALCAELTTLTDEAQAITNPLLPVLTISTPARQYQTLPLISGLVRSKHEQAISDALSNSASAYTSVSYETDAKNQLRELRASMSSNQGLSYLPTLRTVQYQMYSERQRYWNDHADLSNLLRALSLYRERHCALVADKLLVGMNCNDPTLSL